jgi:hypothetical protein
MVWSHLSIDSGTKVAYQILQGAKVPNTVQVPLLEITTKVLNTTQALRPARHSHGAPRHRQ